MHGLDNNQERILVKNQSACERFTLLIEAFIYDSNY